MKRSTTECMKIVDIIYQYQSEKCRKIQSLPPVAKFCRLCTGRARYYLKENNQFTTINVRFKHFCSCSVNFFKGFCRIKSTNKEPLCLITNNYFAKKSVHCTVSDLDLVCQIQPSANNLYDNQDNKFYATIFENL